VVRNAAAIVWDMLYGVDDKLQPQRQMVASEEVSADGLPWTFRAASDATNSTVILTEDIAMLRGSICAFVVAAVLSVALTGANAFDESKYPSWKGQWTRIGGAGSYDPTKPPGPPQEPPLTAEYRAIWEANIAEARAGGQYYNPPVRCIPHGMPRMMMAFEPMEIIIVPDVTYIYMSLYSGFRRIYNDGRDFPKDDVPSFAGYSVGKWIDEDGDGRYDMLEVETRNLNGPRLF
jgi:hypothetical protein